MDREHVEIVQHNLTWWTKDKLGNNKILIRKVQEQLREIKKSNILDQVI